MMKKNPFSFIASQIEGSLPESIRPMTDEARQMVRGAISEKLAQFDLVPREEFEQQERLLARAEKRVLDLEARVSALEKQQSGTSGAVSPAAEQVGKAVPESDAQQSHSE